MGREKETDRRRQRCWLGLHYQSDTCYACRTASLFTRAIPSQYGMDCLFISCTLTTSCGRFSRTDGGPFPWFCMMINLKQPPSQRRSLSLSSSYESRDAHLGLIPSERFVGWVSLSRDFRIDNFYFAAGGREGRGNER